jgi:predicted PurR-regulated permease PerM
MEVRAQPAPELTARRFIFALLVAAAAALALIVYELLSALAIAAVLAALLSPLQKRLAHWLRGRPKLSATLLVVAVILIIIGPTVSLSAYLVSQVSQGANFVADTLKDTGVNGLVEKLPGPTRSIAQKAINLFPGAHLPDLGKTIQEQGSKAMQAVGGVVTATWSFFFQLVMMLIALYFFLAQGGQLLDWIDQMLPLRRGQTHELVSEFRKVSRSIVLSTLATAGAQAVVGLIGYLIARVPYPVFFFAATFVFAFIPAIGAGAVCGCAAVVLFLTGHLYMGIFLAVWAIFAVGLIDNVIKPLVIRGGMNMNGGIVFFALIGGLAAFGAIGLLVGPFVVALFIAVLRMYWRDFAHKPGGEGPPPTAAVPA